MRRILAVFLLVFMFFNLSATAESSVIHNKIKNPDDPFTFPEDTQLLEIYFPKIYDNLSAFIRYGEYTMLLDSPGDQWQQTYALLQQLNVTELDYAFLSHPHTDHMYGFQFILADIPADVFVHTFPEESPHNSFAAPKVYAALHELGVPFLRLSSDDEIDLGDIGFTTYQLDDDKSGNNSSTMIHLTFGDCSILFPADVQINSQRAYAAQKIPIASDIMVAPHHGYNNTQQVFLDLVQPELVIITSLRSSANVLTCLKNNSISYLFTDIGTLRLTTDGSAWIVERIK